MPALELVTAQATAPGAGAAFAAVVGNSLTLRDSRSPIYMVDLWQFRQTAGFTRITSPLLHDAVVGIQGRGPIGHGHIYRGWESRLYPQDTLAVFGSGGAGAAIEFVQWLAYYEDLPGVHANLIDAAELERRGEDLFCFQATLATGTAGGYSGSELIASEASQDQLKANTEYAWVGATAQVAAGSAAVRMVGPDFGNLGIGMPLMGALASAPLGGRGTDGFFWTLSRDLAAPLIPVISSANKSLTFVDAATDDSGVDPVLVINLVRLGPKGTGKRKPK